MLFLLAIQDKVDEKWMLVILKFLISGEKWKKNWVVKLSIWLTKLIKIFNDYQKWLWESKKTTTSKQKQQNKRLNLGIRRPSIPWIDFELFIIVLQQ